MSDINMYRLRDLRAVVCIKKPLTKMDVFLLTSAPLCICSFNTFLFSLSRLGFFFIWRGWPIRQLPCSAQKAAASR